MNSKKNENYRYVEFCHAPVPRKGYKHIGELLKAVQWNNAK